MTACLFSAWSLTPPVLFTLIVSGGVLLLALKISHQRLFAGRHSFIWIHITSIWWLVAASLEMAFYSPECKTFWASMAWPAIIAMPTLWAVFLWQYLNSSFTRLSRKRKLLLAIMPLAVWLLALSNPWHHWIYSPATAPINATPGAALDYQHGPLFYMAALYVYGLMCFCMISVIRAAVISKGLYLGHYLAFIVITAVPWAANLGYVVFGWTLFGFDPTPFSFAVTLMAFAWLVIGAGLFDVLPLARHLLLEAMHDPALVVDSNERVIEANLAALSLADLRPETSWQGKDLQHWPVYGTHLQSLLAQCRDDHHEQLLSLESHQRHYEVRVRTITRQAREGFITLGKMLYLRDVTQRHLSELKLAEALSVSEKRLSIISDLHDLLREQALRDPLTGLFNRRYLDEYFAREIARVERENGSLTLALIDLDHFKRLNDTHGHLVGDDVLKAVAGFFLENLRTTDAVFRIGGEEFLVIMSANKVCEAQARLQKLCSDLSATPLLTRKGNHQITLSAGLSRAPQQGKTLDELIHKADAALYAAKHGGRNQIHVWGES
jgi:diguanylate cyclase (GGDEF)-like protein